MAQLRQPETVIPLCLGKFESFMRAAKVLPSRIQTLAHADTSTLQSAVFQACTSITYKPLASTGSQRSLVWSSCARPGYLKSVLVAAFCAHATSKGIKMVWQCLVAVLALSPGTAAHAQSVELAKSQISFGFRQENVPGDGKFRKFAAQVSFDPAKPDATKAAIEVDVTSIDLGDENWNRDALGASWFNGNQFPKASFNLNTAKALGGGRFEAPAKFTLKGITKDVVASFSAKADAGGTLIEGMVPLKRLDFKIGEGSWADTAVVANEVAVRFKVYLKK